MLLFVCFINLILFNGTNIVNSNEKVNILNSYNKRLREGLALAMIFDELFNNSNCLLLALGPPWLLSATISTDVVPQLLALEPLAREGRA